MTITDHICDRFQPPTPREDRPTPDGWTPEECEQMDAALEQLSVDAGAMLEDFVAAMPTDWKAPDWPLPAALPKSVHTGFTVNEWDLVWMLAVVWRLAELMKGRTR
jgi:hypothetical protein